MSGQWIYNTPGEYGERLENKYHKFRYLAGGLPKRDFACRPENTAITYRTTCLDTILTLQSQLSGGLLINIGDSEDDNNGDTIYAGLLKTQHNFDLLINALSATINQVHEAENSPTRLKREITDTGYILEINPRGSETLSNIPAGNYTFEYISGGWKGSPSAKYSIADWWVNVENVSDFNVSTYSSIDGFRLKQDLDPSMRYEVGEIPQKPLQSPYRYIAFSHTGGDITAKVVDNHATDNSDHPSGPATFKLLEGIDAPLYSDSLWVDVLRGDISPDAQVGTWVSAPTANSAQYEPTKSVDAFYSTSTDQYIPIGVITEMDSISARITTHGYVDVFNNLIPNTTYYITSSAGKAGVYSEVGQTDIYVPVLKSLTPSSGIVDIRREYYNMLDIYSRDITDSSSTHISIYDGCSGCISTPTSPPPITTGSSISLNPGTNQYYTKASQNITQLRLHQPLYSPQSGSSILYVRSRNTYSLYDCNSGGINNPPTINHTESVASDAEVALINTPSRSLYTYEKTGIIRVKSLDDTTDLTRIYDIPSITHRTPKLSDNVLTKNGVMYVSTKYSLIAFDTSANDLKWMVSPSSITTGISDSCITDSSILLHEPARGTSTNRQSGLYKIDIYNGLVVNQTFIDGLSQCSISVDQNNDIYIPKRESMNIIDNTTLDVIHTELWSNIIPVGSVPWTASTLYSVKCCACNDTDNNMYILVKTVENNNSTNYQHHLISLTSDLTFRWQYIIDSSGSHTNCNEIIVGDNNRVYVVTGEGKVYAVNSVDGSEEWVSDVQPPVSTSLVSNLPVLLTESGILIFAINEYIYQVQTDSRLCKSSWPMNGANPMLTYCAD